MEWNIFEIAKQITNSFNSFDNLEEYDEQKDFRNDDLYKKVDLKYSDLSVEQSGILLKSQERKKYTRPFANVEIKNNNTKNSGFKLVKSQNNQSNNCNFKESIGSMANIKKSKRY